MKNFFLYLSGVLYSTKQNLLTWKHPKIYPLLILLISFIMLLSPIQFNMMSTSSEALINDLPHIEEVLKSVSIDLKEKNIDVKIENDQINIQEPYQNYIEGYTIYIGVDLKEYPEVSNLEVQKTDNLVVFGNDRFYARYIERNERNVLENTRTLSGTYIRSNSFDFDYIYEKKNNNEELHSIIGTLLKMIFLSNSGSNLIFWILIIETYNLIFLLVGSFLLLLFNIKGNRDYKLNYSQSFFTIMGSLIFPSLITSFIGMISFKYFALSYVLLSLIRLFMLCFYQISKNNKYNQLKTHIKDEDFELNF